MKNDLFNEKSDKKGIKTKDKLLKKVKENQQFLLNGIDLKFRKIAASQ